ncbi:DUF4167 domain-containing protein [Mesorhizobium sp. A623]
MRPQQQNRRMRGRNNNGGGGGNSNNNNNNNRKGPNPLTRNYESNGPDVKIRGSAQQIAEKYATLARDAQSSGDRVMAENYLQHAEHYNRIIAAAQAQMPVQNVQNNRDDFDDDGDEDRDDFDNNGHNAQADSSTERANNGSGPQPVIEGTPAEIALNTESAGEGGSEERNSRQRERRPSRGYGQNGQRGDHQSRGEQNGSRDEADRQNGAPASSDASPAIAADAASEAVAAPVASSEHLSPAELAARAELNEAAAETPRRPRRPRRPRVSADSAAAEGAEAPAEAAAVEPAVSES